MSCSIRSRRTGDLEELVGEDVPAQGVTECRIVIHGVEDVLEAVDGRRHGRVFGDHLTFGAVLRGTGVLSVDDFKIQRGGLQCELLLRTALPR